MSKIPSGPRGDELRSAIRDLLMGAHSLIVSAFSQYLGVDPFSFSKPTFGMDVAELKDYLLDRALDQPNPEDAFLKLVNLTYFEDSSGEALRTTKSYREFDDSVLVPRGIVLGKSGFIYRDRTPGKSEKMGAMEESDANSDPSKVFLVHGRDLRPYWVMEQFLHFAGLKVISWAEATDLTGKAQPTTFEVVKAGIDAAQVTIVIWSPDDQARLSTQLEGPPNNNNLGDSVIMGQARQNVILEAGIAFGNAPDRTIFVVSGDVRMPSDIIGFNWVKLSGDWDSRKNMINRLRVAGAKVQLHDDDLRNRLAGPFKVE